MGSGLRKRVGERTKKIRNDVFSGVAISEAGSKSFGSPTLFKFYKAFFTTEHLLSQEWLLDNAIEKKRTGANLHPCVSCFFFLHFKGVRCCCRVKFFVRWMFARHSKNKSFWCRHLFPNLSKKVWTKGRFFCSITLLPSGFKVIFSHIKNRLAANY